MRKTNTSMQRRTTHMQKSSAILVKWTYVFLILLAVTVNTFSGERSPVARAIPSTFSDGCPDLPIGVAAGSHVLSPFGRCYYWASEQSQGQCLPPYNIQASSVCVALNGPPFKGTSGAGCPPAPPPGDAQHPGNTQIVYADSGNTGICFYLTTQGSSSCTGSYTVYFVPDCTVMAALNSGLAGGSPPGCPSGPTGVQVYLSALLDSCYYTGTSCATGYTPLGLNCVDQLTSSLTKATNCPLPPPSISPPPTVYQSSLGLDCFFLSPDGINDVCVGSYTAFLVPDCVDHGPFLSTKLPTPGCPNNGTPSSAPATCSFSSSNGPNKIGPTCGQGYIYVTSSSKCQFNGAVNLDDPSSIPCKLTNGYEESGGEGGTVYICNYTKGQNNGQTLTCNIGGGQETCTHAGFYDCNVSGINPYYPNDCDYYGPGGSENSSLLGHSTCIITSMVDCTIKTCFIDTALMSCDRADISDVKTIQVSIEQQCTPQQDQKILDCSYVYNQQTYKIKRYTTNCTGTSTPVCSISGPHSLSLGQGKSQSCTGSTPPNFTCQVSGSPQGQWSLDCNQGSSAAYPHCDLKSSDNQLLGAIDCPNIQTVAQATGVTCTIADDNGNQMVITCTTSNPDACISTTPECPNGGSNPLQESDLLCDGLLIMGDLLMKDFKTNPTFTFAYPLSQGELEFTLQKLGIGSQSWLSDPNNTNLAIINGL